MAPNKAKNYCNRISKKEFVQKTVKNIQNFYVLPPRVQVPSYRVPRDLAIVVTRNLQPCVQMTPQCVKYLSILEILQDGGLKLDQNNYCAVLKLMLYLEQIQQQLDMKRFDQHDKVIEKVSSTTNKFKIYVEGLEENRPSVRPEDVIEIYDSKSITFYLRVINVAKDYILAVAGQRFVNIFSPHKTYNLRFRCNEYPSNCSHHALTLTHQHQISKYFFPENEISFTKTANKDFWFNKSIESNPQQKQAVLNIVSNSSSHAPYILYGPPGTGKTATLVEAICQIYGNSSLDTHILVCTPSNSAADEITRRLLVYITDQNTIHRMYSPSKEGSSIDTAIVGCSNFVNGQVMMLPEEAIKQKTIVLCTLCAATRLLFMGFKEKHFSHIFIDEAGQATEPDSLIPLNLLTSCKPGRIGLLHGQVILAGDPQQLGPSIRSKLAEPILGRSLMERLMECKPYRKNEHNQYNPFFITKLLRNYRSHPNIIHVSNELFYENELQPCADDNSHRAVAWNGLPNKGFPVIFHGVEGIEQRENRSPSIFNVKEVDMVMGYVNNLVGYRLGNSVVRQSDIGIITPFAAQRIKLHQALDARRLDHIDVGTVELFQGQERDIIIMSTVRSEIFRHDERFHIGFLSNPKRFNVALTRAKTLLIIIGDPNVLKVDPHWRYFLNYCKINGACCGTPFEIREGMDELIKHMYNEKVRTKQERYCDLSVVKIDDGVIDYGVGETENEENPITSANYQPVSNGHVNRYANNYNYNRPSSNNYNYHGGHGNAAPASGESMLSDLVMQQFQNMDVGGSETQRKQKKKKRK